MRILTLLFVLCAAVSVASAEPCAAASAIEIVEAGEDADVEAIVPVTTTTSVEVAERAALRFHPTPRPAPIAPPPIPPPER